MSSAPEGSGDPGDPSGPPSPERGPGPANVHPIGPGPLVGLGALAMVLGWSIRPLSIRFDVAEPVISVWPVAVIWVLAAAVGLVAYRTWRILQRRHRPGLAELSTRGRIEPYQAVNRLVLGKAAAVAGAVVLGGYAGFALAHIGIPPTELSGQRLLRSSVAAAGGLALLVAGLMLERACRVRTDAD